MVIVTEHGSWNRTSPIGNKVSTMSLEDLSMSVLYENETFSSGFTQSFVTSDRYTYRPTGTCIDMNGSILVASDPRTTNHKLLVLLNLYLFEAQVLQEMLIQRMAYT